MACSWLYLASRTTAQRFCDKPGHPYCPEHQREMDSMEQADKDWVEILATHMAVCEEPKVEQKLCAVCNRLPVHDDCVYCDVCCADDPLDIVGPQG
jgi:hypothetical protein